MPYHVPRWQRVRTLAIVVPAMLDGLAARARFSLTTCQWAFLWTDPARASQKVAGKRRHGRLQNAARTLAIDIRDLAPLILAVQWQLWIVLAASIVTMAIVGTHMPFWYGGSDHSDYYWYGRYLLGDGYRGYSVPANWRTPGMGLFHILSGTVLFDTWIGFIAISYAFGVAIPVMIYLMVRPHSRNFALFAALGAVLSMTPFLYAHFAGSDHIYFFFHTLLLLLCVRYFQRRIQATPALLTGIVAVAAAACLVRPVGAVIFWIFIALTLIIRPRDWRRLAAAGCAYMVVMALWVTWDRAYGTNGSATIGLGYPQLNDMTSSAERRFAEAYFSSEGLVHLESDQAASGYANSQKLRQTLREYLSAHQNGWQNPSLFTPPSLFARFAAESDPADRLLDAILVDRNYLYFSFVVRSLEESLGKDEATALLYGVASEQGTAGIYGIVRNFVLHPAQLLFGVTPNLSGRTIYALLYFAKTRNSELSIGGLQNIPDPLLSPELGPSNALILDTFRRFIDDYPQYWPEPFAEEFHGNPDGLYQRTLRPRTFAEAINLEGFLYQSVNWYLDPAIAGRTYLGAAIEILRRYPKLAVLFYDNAVDFTIARRIGDVAAPLDRATLDQMSDTYFESRAQVVNDLPPGLAKGLTPVVTANGVWKDASALNMVVYLISPVFVFLLIVSLPFIRDPLVFGPALFLIFDYGYEVASIAMFGMGGAERYEANFYLLPLIISCMLIGQAVTRRLRRANVSVGGQPLIGA